MKIVKTTFIILSLSFISFVSFGQVTYKNGNLGIDWSTPSHKLTVHGEAKFIGGWSSVLLDWDHGYNSFPQACIYPENSWYLNLGTPDRLIGIMYADHVRARAVGSLSDETLKENIEKLSPTLEKIKQVNSYKYNFKDQYSSGMPDKMKNKLKNKKEIGFSAQELEKIFPEIVDVDDNGLYSVQYSKMTPILVEAIKE